MQLTSTIITIRTPGYTARFAATAQTDAAGFIDGTEGTTLSGAAVTGAMDALRAAGATIEGYDDEERIPQNRPNCAICGLTIATDAEAEWTEIAGFVHARCTQPPLTEAEREAGYATIFGWEQGGWDRRDWLNFLIDNMGADWVRAATAEHQADIDREREENRAGGK